MTELHNRSGRELLVSMRRAHDAPAGAKQRIQAALLASLPVTVPPPAASAPTTASATATGSVWTSLAAVVGTTVVVTCIALGSISALRSEGVARPSPSTSVAVSTFLPESSPAPRTLELPALPISVPASSESTKTARRVRVSPTPSSPLRSSLAEEVRLVRAAHHAREAGDFSAALTQLGSHEREFPNGTLAEERELETVLVLCALGRVDDARKRSAAFQRTYPASAHMDRVLSSCGASSRHEPATERALTP